MFLLVCLKEFLTVFQIGRWEPFVVGVGVSFPSNVELVSSSPFPMGKDLFDFIFFLVVDDVWGWFGECWSVSVGFFEW